MADRSLTIPAFRRYSGNRQPIEYADGEKVLVAIKNAIAAARSIPSGKKRQDRLELWSDAADHGTFMKDIWRNNISHTRKPCSVIDADAAFGRVHEFMEFLAAKEGRL